MYSSDTDTYTYRVENGGMDFATLRIIVCVVVILAEIIWVGLVFCYIKCCCPTSLKRVRPGLVLSDDNRVRTVQPIVIQNMPPAENAQVAIHQPATPPPQYSAEQPYPVERIPLDEKHRTPLIGDC